MFVSSFAQKLEHKMWIYDIQSSCKFDASPCSYRKPALALRLPFFADVHRLKNSFCNSLKFLATFIINQVHTYVIFNIQYHISQIHVDTSWHDMIF